MHAQARAIVVVSVAEQQQLHLFAQACLRGVIDVLSSGKTKALL